MPYVCECGNTERFQEIFQAAVNIVDGAAEFIETESRDVAHYVCDDCQREIPYIVFFPRAVYPTQLSSNDQIPRQ